MITFSIVFWEVFYYFPAGKIIMVLIIVHNLLNLTITICLFYVNKELYTFSQLIIKVVHVKQADLFIFKYLGF